MELRADKLVVFRDGRLALDGVDWELPAGCRALVTGPASSGKTTLLKALAALLPATHGRVLWDGVDVATLSYEARRAGQARLGMVFQTDALFDSMSVLDNVRLPLLRRRVSEAEATLRAEEALRQVGLLDAAHALPERLSGGMKKRAGIARAIVARPELLLADDPLAGLDPHTARSVCELLLEVSQGRALLVAAPEPIAHLPLAPVLALRRAEPPRRAAS
ncbi:MAG: ATP-binding cassette domain-containing protein [Myxococcota bacterium]